VPAAGALFHDVRIVDGRGGEPLADAALLVEGDTITWLGPARSAPSAGEGIVEVDGAGATLLPGFVDCHVHLAWPGGSGVSLFDSLPQPTSLRLLSALGNLRRTIERGVTTVRDCLGLDLGFKLAVEQGVVPGPRILFAATMMCSTGGHADFGLPSGFNPYWQLVAPGCVEPFADGPDACRRKVREMVRAGSDFVKVAATGGVSSPADEPDWAGFTVEELRAIVDEADAHGGRVVAAHCLGREGIRRSLEAGVPSIEHGVDLPDELCDEMVRRGAVLVATAVQLDGEMDPAVVLPSTYEQFQVWREIGRASLPRAIERGVTIAMGTDCGVSTVHGDNLRELSCLVRAGMSPMDAIVAGTKTAAELLQIDGITGTLEEGKRADLVLVSGDPLASIDLLCDPDQIVLVMKDGRTFKEPAGPGLEELRAGSRH
jgi:imidazolonepropionase-like amidohydrolase